MHHPQTSSHQTPTPIEGSKKAYVYACCVHVHTGSNQCTFTAEAKEAARVEARVAEARAVVRAAAREAAMAAAVLVG